MTATITGSSPDSSPEPAPPPDSPLQGGPASTALRRVGYLLLAGLAYIPIMLTSPGRVVADTKSYLYLDPGRLLDRAASMWDPNIGMGTVTHQNIGYLFPMGPFFWLFHMAGVPAWVSQRIWLGSIFLFAGLGVLFLMRTLNVRGPGVPVAALLFMLTPYSLDFASRISVLLLPWAGLPWMLALVIRALRDDGGWRYPAIFAIVVQVIGGVNATALVFAGIAPVLWIFYSAAISREVQWRRAWATIGKIGLLTLLASAWWIAGLSIQSGYGLNVLKYTETLETVSTASVASEVLRGLGYWFFYGRDKLGPWTESSVDYTQHLWLIVVGFAIPVLAMFAAACIRVAPPRVLHPPRADRRDRGGGRVPLRPPVGARRHLQVVRRVVELRSRVAQHRARGAVGGVVVRGVARRRDQRRGQAVHVARCGDARARARRAGDRARDREPARDLERHVLRQEPPARREHPELLDQGHRHVRRQAARHARARTSRRRLRVVPVGQHRRSDHARPDGPALRRARS